MASRFFKLTAVAAAALLYGCASDPAYPPVSLDQIYGDIHRTGGRDAVQLLREGMNTRMTMGSSDPYYPVRQPEEVVPVWVVSYNDPRTGRHIEGHWEFTVLKPARWAD